MDDKILQEKREKTALVLTNVYNLPSMSAIMMEVSRLLDDPSTNTDKLSKMIGKDQGLSTKILSIANSPLYGLPRKVSTIDFAILIIGFQDIKNIVIALSMIDSFKNKSDKNLNQEEFWKHSIITGNAAKRIAEDLGFRIGGEAFVAGLLHDLGIPVIHKYFHSSFLEIIEAVNEGGIFLEAEFNTLGMTHAEIGRFLAAKWNLPAPLVDAVIHHHDPGKSEENEVLTAVVHLADYMTQFLELGAFYWDSTNKLDPAVLEILKFENEEAVNEFMEKYRELFTKELEAIRL
ncbi:MAG: HDOD domain-containing protein [Melioribacteraceae bacterium]|nr:HDOD domain-containing protein [Melioribacteraceae bacterium]